MKLRSSLAFMPLIGSALNKYIGDLALLRIKIFREYPYLYDGDLEYETHYLKTYSDSPNSHIWLVVDKNKIVGATTSIPLSEEVKELQQPFLQHNLDVNQFLYLGESILLPEYRGKGIYRKFFTYRENIAKKYGFQKTVFMSVKRPIDCKLRPYSYKPLDIVWKNFGYKEAPSLTVAFAWKEIGEAEMSKKPLTIWQKTI